MISTNSECYKKLRLAAVIVAVAAILVATMAVVATILAAVQW